MLLLTPVRLFPCADVRLFKAAIHEKFVGRCFKDVFHYFAKHFDVVCIGLYRAHDVAVVRPDNAGSGHYFRPYVYTAPNPLSIIGKGDEVFYFGESLPSFFQSQFFMAPVASNVLDSLWRPSHYRARSRSVRALRKHRRGRVNLRIELTG